MKYKIVSYKYDGDDFYSIEIMLPEGFSSFPAIVGNPNYDNFLEQTELTDDEVHSLKTDVWHEI